MRYIKENIIQILAMIASLCMLAYGYRNDNSLVMVVSAVLPIVVWFIDKYFSIKKEREAEKTINELKECLTWK